MNGNYIAPIEREPLGMTNLVPQAIEVIRRINYSIGLDGFNIAHHVSPGVISDHTAARWAPTIDNAIVYGEFAAVAVLGIAAYYHRSRWVPVVSEKLSSVAERLTGLLERSDGYFRSRTLSKYRKKVSGRPAELRGRRFNQFNARLNAFLSYGTTKRQKRAAKEIVKNIVANSTTPRATLGAILEKLNPNMNYEQMLAVAQRTSGYRSN